MSRDQFQAPEPSPALIRALDAVVLEHMRRPFINRNELVNELAEAVLDVTQPIPAPGLVGLSADV